MREAFREFLKLPAMYRRDVFEATAQRLGTLATYVEKDFWVCLVLDILYHDRPADHPALFFKGGTSLSKAFGLIQRFSEDIDIAVSRHDLGFRGDQDPFRVKSTKNQRDKMFKALDRTDGKYVSGELATALSASLDTLPQGCTVYPDMEARTFPSLSIEYPTLFPSPGIAYVQPRVKIEAGARSALDPAQISTITPYISGDLDGWQFDVKNVKTIGAERTYWEKLLILHGYHCGYRDEGRLPADKDRVSRHYYDVAIVTASEIGKSALANIELLRSVREHNLTAFPRAWKKFEEARPNTLRCIPQPKLCEAIEKDYGAMEGMITGNAPSFTWIMAQLDLVQNAINDRSI